MNIRICTPETGFDTKFGKYAIIDFLYEHLEQFGDTPEAIEQCLLYAMGELPHRRGMILLGIEGGKLLGVVVLNETGMGGYIPENILVYIAVHGQHRGKGAGKQLVRAAIDHTDGDIALHVDSTNPAIKLYERLGFTTPYLEMRLKKKNDVPVYEHAVKARQ